MQQSHKSTLRFYVENPLWEKPWDRSPPKNFHYHKKWVHNCSSSDSTKGYNKYIIKNNLFSDYNKIKESNVREKLTTLTALFSVKTTSFHTTNFQSNRSEWRVTCLEASVQISARSNGERTGNWRKKTDCSAASSSFFLSVFLCSLVQICSPSLSSAFYSGRHI